MLIYFRALAVVFAVLTLVQNFSSDKVVSNTLGTGLVAITFGVLSLGREDRT
jgi:hypothetical protein